MTGTEDDEPVEPARVVADPASDTEPGDTEPDDTEPDDTEADGTEADGTELEDTEPVMGMESVEQVDEAGLAAVLEHVREQRGFDFTGYKRASLVRRIQRRLEAVGLTTLEDYLDHLTVHPAELGLLFDTVLINVTGFFRDPAAWDYLRTEFLPRLVAGDANRSIRVWSAGCASGEEAYTLAMVLAELVGLEGMRDRVKIYATDVDEAALAHARAASYSVADVSAVPPELRERYFEPVGDRLVVRKELRRTVIFGRNDLVQDAPISHVDVLACRDTLMYFNAETQAQVLNRMHFALRPEGVLFLGKAEMLLSHAAYFRPVELKRRFFRKVPQEQRDRRPNLSLPPPVVDEDAAAARLRQSAMVSSAAAQVVLDPDGRLVFVNQRAMTLFGLTGRDVGRPFQDLEMSYRPVELRSHIDEALHRRSATWIRGVDLVRGLNDAVVLDIQFLPLTEDNSALLGLTIVFNDVTEQRRLQQELEVANSQLETAYEELQSTVEELETTNEELQSTVEELETTNEELQSTNEELETMNEELQSMNDELHYVNETIRDRQEEIGRLNRFMSSVLSSMNSGVAVVDADLQVLAWNTRAEDLWGVRGDEAVGVHLMNLDIGLPVERLRAPLRARLAAGGSAPETIELDAVNRRGRAVRIGVTLTDMQGQSEVAAMLLMDVLDDRGPDPSPRDDPSEPGPA